MTEGQFSMFIGIDRLFEVSSGKTPAPSLPARFLRTCQPPPFDPLFEGGAPKQDCHDVCDRTDAPSQRSALLTGLLDSIPNRVFFKDCAGVYLGWNPEFSRFVGRPREEIVGRTDYELFSAKDADLQASFQTRPAVGRRPKKNSQ